MESKIDQQPKNTKLKIAVDILSAIFVIFLLIVCPIWGHYAPPESKDINGNMVLMLKLLLADLAPSIFGVIWLVMRYINVIVAIGRKYPFTRGVQYAPPFILAMIFLYPIGRLIFENIWR